MALQKVGEKALAAIDSKTQTVTPVKETKKKVLDEDTYVEGLEKIIVRDFYPDLPKLKAQKEYLEALEKNDVQKLRELHIKYGPKRPNSGTPNIYSTPATFETPDARGKQTPLPDGAAKETVNQGTGEEEEAPTHNPEPEVVKEKSSTDLSLDKYLAKNTSEDNASFGEILKENQKRHEIKHAWLYRKEEEQNKEKEQMLALPSIEVQAIEGTSKDVQTWNYKPQNTLMYVPDGVADSAKERIEKQKSKPREIAHGNTRFMDNPFNMQKSKESIAQAAVEQAQALQGRIGVDGKEILPAQSPSVNGYGFVATPSPAPGVDESPLMTWGEIEGTPFRLDGGDTPVPRTPGPVFKIPAVPKRDRLAMELAEKVGKAHRAKKEEALRRVTALRTPSPRFGASKTDRLNSMSPAAQRLASTKLGIRTHTDRALRASYTPSPSHRLPGEKTPIQRTPKSGAATPTPKSARGTPTPKRDSSEVTSLTDNLLNLPKRKRAQDFF